MARQGLGNDEKLTAYIGLQSAPLGDEPLFSMSFGISLRVFCIALALKEKEGKLPEQDEEDAGDEDAGDVEVGIEDGAGDSGDGGT